MLRQLKIKPYFNIRCDDNGHLFPRDAEEYGRFPQRSTILTVRARSIPESVLSLGVPSLSRYDQCRKRANSHFARNKMNTSRNITVSSATNKTEPPGGREVGGGGGGGGDCEKRHLVSEHSAAAWWRQLHYSTRTTPGGHTVNTRMFNSQAVSKH